MLAGRSHTGILCVFRGFRAGSCTGSAHGSSSPAYAAFTFFLLFTDSLLHRCLSPEQMSTTPCSQSGVTIAFPHGRTSFQTESQFTMGSALVLLLRTEERVKVLIWNRRICFVAQGTGVRIPSAEMGFSPRTGSLPWAQVPAPGAGHQRVLELGSRPRGTEPTVPGSRCLCAVSQSEEGVGQSREE